MWTVHRRKFITIVDKHFKYETLFDEDIIRTEIAVFQYKDDPDEDLFEVGHAKGPLMEEIKSLELTLRYVGQRLTTSLHILTYIINIS